MMETTKWPEGFVLRMQHQLGEEASDFFNALAQPSPVSIRLHYQKGRTSFPSHGTVKWCDRGLYLEKRPYFSMDPHWHAGGYYVQEASSMILDAVVGQLHLDEKPKIWLDLCAAPGGKTGILAGHLRPQDILVANEVVSQRRSVLYENLVKGGYLNTFISGEKTSSIPYQFADIILIDAPCSGEGMMRKEPEAIKQWSERLVQSCSTLQQEIIRHSMEALKPGGYLIYSTCSYSPDENIRNAKFLSTIEETEHISFSFPPDWNIQEINEHGVYGYQLYPHKVKGEGLFFTVIHKREAVSSFYSAKKSIRHYKAATDSFSFPAFEKDNYLIENQREGIGFIRQEAATSADEVRQKLPRAELISTVGEQKGKDFIPSHFYAMSMCNKQSIPIISLSPDQALDYLERQTSLPHGGQSPGWYLANFDQSNLGWLKSTGQGWKNHYPMHWRLRQRN